MGAPNVTYSVSKTRLSRASGFDSISVKFSADAAYAAFECRATKAGQAWGVGVGSLVASFSTTPAGVERTFEIYDDYLVNGDGEYRISLFVKAPGGSWNDTIGFIPRGATDPMVCSDGATFLSRKGDA